MYAPAQSPAWHELACATSVKGWGNACHRVLDSPAGQFLLGLRGGFASIRILAGPKTEAAAFPCSSTIVVEVFTGRSAVKSRLPMSAAVPTNSAANPKPIIALSEERSGFLFMIKL